MKLPPKTVKKNTACYDWEQAARLCEAYSANPQRVDALAGRKLEFEDPVTRRRCQRLFLGVIRWLSVIDHTIDTLLHRSPRARCRAVLQIAVYELIDTIWINPDPDRIPRTIHHAVACMRALCSESESRLANAVLRKIPDRLRAIDSSGRVSERHALPEWLVERLEAMHGADAPGAFGEWQSRPSPTYIRWATETTPPPPEFAATRWCGVYSVEGSHWSIAEAALQNGTAYAQDPSTLIPVSLLAPRPGESIADLCAAPGGKTVQIIKRLGSDPSGSVLAVDLPGHRCERLDENLRKLADDSGPLVQLLAANVAELDPSKTGLFDGVLLDAPCSNTGVIRRRPDVKWRLRPVDFERCAALQDQLLASAARLVAPGGRLVYSTCSIDRLENEDRIAAFLESNPAFKCVSKSISLPWEADHDGGAAFRLDRVSTKTRSLMDENPVHQSNADPSSHRTP